MLVFSLTYLDSKNSQQSYSFTGRTGIRFCSAATPLKFRYRGASRRKVFQICKRGSRRDVVDRVTTKPSMNVGSPGLIRWIRSRRSRSGFGSPALFLDFEPQNALSAAVETCGRKAQEGSCVFSLNAPVSFSSLRNIAGHAAFQHPNETIATGFLMRKNLLSILSVIRKRRCAKRESKKLTTKEAAPAST